MDSTGGALLVGMDLTGGESSMRKEDGERSKKEPTRSELLRLADEIWQRHIASLDSKSKAALLAEMDSAGGESSRRMRSKKQRVVLDHMMPSSRGRLMELYYAMKWELAKAPLPGEEGRDLLSRKKEKSARRAKVPKSKAAMAADTKKNQKAQHEETVRPEESVTEAGTVGSSKSADEVMGKETLQQLLKGMPNKFDILDPDGDDERDEIYMGRSAIEEEHMPSDRKNPSEGEESVTVGSVKSAIDKAVISLDTEKSISEAEEGALLVGMDSTGGDPSICKEESGKRPEMQRGPLVGVMIGGKIHSKVPLGMALRLCKEGTIEGALLASHEKLVGLNSTGGESSMHKESEEESGKRSEMVGNKSEMQWHAEEPVPDFKSSLPPEYREKLMEHNTERAVKMNALLFSHEKLSESSERCESTVGKSLLDITGITPETQLYEEIQRTLLHIQEKLATSKKKEKLAKKNSRKMDKEILRLLNDVCNMLDQGGDDDEKDEDTNEGTNTTMVKSDNEPAGPIATNAITVQDDHDSEMAYRAGTLQQLLKDLSDSYDRSMRGAPAIQEHTPPSHSVTRLGQCSVQDDLGHDEMAKKDKVAKKDKMAKKTAEEEMADEAENFADYRRVWESAWRETCGLFEHMTVLSSMQFTCYTPGRSPPNSAASTPATLQIFSIKLAELDGGLKWPLSVYGVVAVRDVADHNRNYLFYCDRDSSQELTENDPFLRLIGPSRAVVYTEEVNCEIELKVKGTTDTQDKALITEGRDCLEVFGDGASTVCFGNCFCTMELCAQVVRRTTQATILGVQVVECGQWPFKYGARVACYSLPGQVVVEDNRVTFVTFPAAGEIVMVDSKDGAILKGGGGYLHLPRNVISVEDQGCLDVDIQTYSESGVIAARGHVSFPAEFSKITRRHCFLGRVKVVITVAWSQVAEDKHDVSALGYLV